MNRIDSASDRDTTVACDCTEPNDLAQGRENGYMILVKMAECKTVYGIDFTIRKVSGGIALKCIVVSAVKEKADPPGVVAYAQNPWPTLSNVKVNIQTVPFVCPLLDSGSCSWSRWSQANVRHMHPQGGASSGGTQPITLPSYFARRHLKQKWKTFLASGIDDQESCVSQLLV